MTAPKLAPTTNTALSKPPSLSPGANTAPCAKSTGSPPSVVVLSYAAEAPAQGEARSTFIRAANLIGADVIRVFWCGGGWGKWAGSELISDVSVAAVAAETGMSRLTLYRRLKSEDTAFFGVMDDLRCRLASDYLIVRKVSLNQTTDLMGVSETSSFVRAVRRGTGQTPAELRPAALA